MEDSSVQNYDKYAFDHYCGLNYIPDPDSFTTLFTDIMTRDRIRSFMSDWMVIQLERNGHKDIVVDFDSSNENTAGTDIEYAEDGKPKVEEDIPQVNWVNLVDRETGTILYMDVFYGSIVDMNHCAVVLDKVKSILGEKGWKKKGKLKNVKKLAFTLCFDRGYYTSVIMNYLNNSFDFVVLGKESVSSRNLIEAHPKTVMVRSENRVDSNLYGIRVANYVPYKNMTNGTYYAYLFYRPIDNAVLIDNAESKLRYIAEKITNKKDANGGIRNTYGKFLDIEIDKKTKTIKSARLKPEYIDNVYDTSGYFYIVSNKEMTCKEAYELYKQRDNIEKSFMGMKSLSDGNKTHAHSTDIFDAKIFCSAVCSILRANIRYMMKPYFLQYSSETTETVIREVGKVCIQKINGQRMPMTKLTKQNKQIFSFFELTQKDVDELVKEFNIIDL